jgi:hypothetical protein
MTEPVALNNGRLGVYLNKDIKNPEWYFNETAGEIILFTGSDAVYIDNIYFLDMDNFSLLNSITPTTDTFLFDRTWAADGKIYTATDTEIKTYNPRTLAILNVFTGMAGAGGFSDLKVVSAGNTTVLTGADSIWIGDFSAKTVIQSRAIPVAPPNTNMRLFLRTEDMYILQSIILHENTFNAIFVSHNAKLKFRP